MLNKTKLSTAALALALLAGCATQRGAAYVPVVDSKGADPAAFAADLRECQAFAQQRDDALAGAAGGAVAGAVFGAVIGALIGGSSGARLGASLAATSGAAGGAVRANETQEQIITKCLSGRGHRVLN